MKYLVHLLVFILFLFSTLHSQIERIQKGNLVTEGVPDIPETLADKLFQYQNARSAGFQSWTNDNHILMSTRFGETSQIHLLKSPLGARTQLTFFKEPVSGANASPNINNNGFLFSKDIGGNEFYQVFYFDITSGNYRMLTDGKSRNQNYRWSKDGKKILFTSTKRNGRDYDVYITDLNNYNNPEMVFSREGLWTVTDWSKDNKTLVLLNYISANESKMYTYCLESKLINQINPSEEKIAYGGGIFNKESDGIYFTSDENTEFKHLRYYDIASKKTTIISNKIDWDVAGFTLSKDGESLAFTTNEDGIGKLYLLETKNNKYSSISNIPIGQIYGISFSPNNQLLSIVINTPKSPGDIYVLTLKDKKIERWTQSEVGGLNTENFVEPELIHYPAFDSVDGKQRLIPAFMFTDKSRSVKSPVLINIHGGPEGQFTPTFSAYNNFLAKELGITVIAPNVRGSTGYGKTYLAADNWYKREESVYDIGKLLEWIKTQPYLDSDRIAVIGGSYGGYMVLSSMTHYNDKIRCGIDIVGISNFVTFLTNTQEYRRDLRRVEYGDERIPEMREFLEKISPTTNAHKITKPLFVIQGLNDPRVPVTEAEQIVDIVRKNGGDVWYLLAMDEGHGFAKKSNNDFMYQAITLFLEKHLLN